MQNIKDNLPLISVLLILFGAFRTIQFYKIFNIDILSYLDLTEILQVEYLFLSAVVLIAISFLNGFTKTLQKLYYFFYRDTKKEYDEEKDAIKPETEFEKSVPLLNIDRAALHANLSVLAILMLAGLLIIIISVGYEVIHMAKGKSQYEVSMLVEDKPFKTDSANFFIGRTKNYIFFYNWRTMESSVYANSDVKSLKFKPGKQYVKKQISIRPKP